MQNRRNSKLEREAIGIGTVKDGAIVETKLFKRQDQQQKVGVLREGVGERAMDEYDSGGRSGDKGQGAEDEGSTAPLPEKVYLLVSVWKIVDIFYFLFWFG